MSSSFSRGTTYAFNFDVVNKSSSSTSTITSPSSSPSSTISETSNVSIRTKKPRTNRKRPNQAYNEAATLLSKEYPTLFRNFQKPGNNRKFNKPITEYNDSSSELLLPFRNGYNDASSFLLQNKSASQTEPDRVFSVREKLLSSEEEIISFGVVNSDELERDSGEDFDCESIFDERIEEGIDSIIGSTVEDAAGSGAGASEREIQWLGRFGGKFGLARALRYVDGGNWWNFAVVDVLEISPGLKKTSAVDSVPATEKKKKEPNVEVRDSSPALRLKLNYDDVRKAWSDRGSPFAGDFSGATLPDVTSLSASHLPPAIKNIGRKNLSKKKSV